MTDRKCSWAGCDELVSSTMWGCKTHWMLLPAHLRDELGRALALGGDDPKTSGGYLKANWHAQNWIATAFGGGEVRERRRADWASLVAMVRDRDSARGRRRDGEQLELGLAKPQPYKPPTRCLP